jgi:lysozyme
MDWSVTEAQGIYFAAIRACVGRYFTDPMVYEYVEGIKKTDLYWTLYHVLVPNHSALYQINRLYKVIDQVGKPQFPLILDCEIVNDQPKATINARIKKCLEIMEERDGRKPIIYINPNYTINVLGSPSYLADYDLWIANYSDENAPWVPAPWIKHYIWQWSADGNMQGAKYGASSPSICLDRYNGTKADFVKRYITPELTLEQRVAALEKQVEFVSAMSADNTANILTNVKAIDMNKTMILAVDKILIKLTTWAKGIRYGE